MSRPKISLVVAWYDIWIGAYWDARKRRLYLLPMPCIGVCLDWGSRCALYPELRGEDG